MHLRKVLDDLLPEREGQYALLRHAEIIDFFDDPYGAQLVGMEKFSDGVYSIQRITSVTAIDLGFYSHAESLADS